jgi:hypothetical protein
MKYFLHDTSAFDDEKISDLFKNFGYEGVGLFNVFLEKIGKQEKPVKTDILKFQLKIGKKLEKCWNFMEKIGLISSLNGESFNNNLLNFSESYKIKKEKTREKVSQWRENQKNKKVVTSYETVSNHPKVKESKVKVKKVKENTKENTKESELLNIFEYFRINYPYTKRGLKTEFENFKKKHSDYKEVIESGQLVAALKNQINWRVAFKNADKFVPEWKMLQTWINQRCWEEIHETKELTA